ncbi:MAG TPA: hypothetical protein VL727_05900 [Puia sp.]|nr:hypothetical protein [Puia sp.]
MEKNDYVRIGFLMLVPILVFSPLFYTHYFYTDEVLQLWLYRKGSDFAMFVPQGRWLTDRLFRSLYSHIDTIGQLRLLRLFSLAGWLICLPVWYSVFKRVAREEGLPSQLPFFSVLFLICSLPFSISIQWAACMELFIANTSGLLAGYFVYRYNRRGWLPALLSGLISLFFYQNGFGCFLLPFFLAIVARQKADRKMLAPLGVYFAIYLIYFLLFKGMLQLVLHAGASNRTTLLDNPVNKAVYLFVRVLPQAFLFNGVVNEQSVAGLISFGLIGGVCLGLNFRSGTKQNFLTYCLLIVASFVLIYLPSLIIRENYASNRTLLGLDMAVFFWVFITLMKEFGKTRLLPAFLTISGCLLVLTSVYNFRAVFLRPAVEEYESIKTSLAQHYNPGITSIDYIRTAEGQVREKYGVQSSWDEYGMSSSFFGWVPDVLARQLVFELTGNRSVAEKLTVRVWVNRSAFQASGSPGTEGSLVIDASAILHK